MPLAPPQGPSGVLSAAGKFPPLKLSVPLGLGEDKELSWLWAAHGVPRPCPTLHQPPSVLCSPYAVRGGRWEQGKGLCQTL